MGGAEKGRAERLGLAHDSDAIVASVRATCGANSLLLAPYGSMSSREKCLGELMWP